MEKISKSIGLGTVQFGLDYGINNPKGKVPTEEVRSIVSTYHHDSPNPIYDTAIAYGESQKVLGSVFRDLSIHHPDVVSKFPAVSGEDELESHLKDALTNLGIDSLFAFIAHNAKNLIENHSLISKLQEFVKKGLVQKVGVSAYYPHEIEWFLNNDIPIDLIQIPYNLFDQRFEKMAKESKFRGVEVHIRSVFLQGLIFKPLEFFDTDFSPLKPKIQLIRDLQADTNLTLSQIALLFCLINPSFDKIIIGVDSRENLVQNLNFSITSSQIEKVQEIKDKLSVSDENIILPFNWPKR